MPLLRLALILALATGCKSEGSDEKGGDAGQQAATIAVYPPKGGQGTTLEVDLDATRSSFEFDATEVDFGDGITVEGVTVEDGWGARATIAIAEDAELGGRDVTVTTSGRTWTLSDSFEVIAESFRVEPDTVRIGETASVDIVGRNTAWQGGVTWPSFGDGITVDEFTVLSETLASATLTVEPDTTPGWRNVVMDNGGGDLVTLYDGLKVDRVALAARFDPEVAEQGDTVEFTIQARGTDFTDATPQISFFDRFGENPDVVVDSVTVLDAENLYGQMTLSNAAALGMRDVRLQGPDEGLVITDAFEVVGGDWDLSEVAIDLSFTVVRSKDNTTGEVSERVSASCTFYIPLDPPCPTGGGGGSGSQAGSEPSPYDQNGVWMATGEGSGSEEDCPFPTTIPAGDYVWLESDQNIITLEKQVDSASGVIYYTAPDLTFADYVTDNVYDLHTQGEEGGIGEYLLEGVQPTVPSDWQWVSPDLWGNYTHDRSEDFVFEWTPAMTYPDAMFVVSICTKNSPCAMEEPDWFGYAGAYPWDDGSHMFTAAEMSLMGAGGVPVYAYSYIEGPEFGLPESIYQTNQAHSYIYLSQYMVLE